MDSVTGFKPGPELTFESVVAVRAKLHQAISMEKNEVFYLDLSEVLHCDSAGLALLIEAKKICVHNNKLFQVIGVPSKTQSLAEFCGVSSIIETA